MLDTRVFAEKSLPQRFKNAGPVLDLLLDEHGQDIPTETMMLLHDLLGWLAGNTTLKWSQSKEGHTLKGKTLLTCARHAQRRRNVSGWMIAATIVELAHACHATLSLEGATTHRAAVVRSEIGQLDRWARFGVVREGDAERRARLEAALSILEAPTMPGEPEKGERAWVM